MYARKFSWHQHWIEPVWASSTQLDVSAYRWAMMRAIWESYFADDRRALIIYHDGGGHFMRLLLDCFISSNSHLPAFNLAYTPPLHSATSVHIAPSRTPPLLAELTLLSYFAEPFCRSYSFQHNTSLRRRKSLYIITYAVLLILRHREHKQ